MTMLPYPISESPGSNALSEWSRLREQGRVEGFYPVIVGDADDLERLTEALEDNEADPASIIADAADLDGEAVLKSRVEQEPELYDSVELGSWPADVAHQPFVSHTDLLSGRPKEKVYIVHVPTVYSHDVLAYLKYGGWNECPGPEEHVAIHRMWGEKFGAELVFATGDVIECRVARPPATNEQALELARQQFIYCTDIVFQGVENLAALAASLKNHDVWYFWWD